MCNAPLNRNPRRQGEQQITHLPGPHLLIPALLLQAPSSLPPRPPQMPRLFLQVARAVEVSTPASSASIRSQTAHQPELPKVLPPLHPEYRSRPADRERSPLPRPSLSAGRSSFLDR